jgi:hypothetical protein
MRFAGPLDTIKEIVNESQARAIVYALRQGVTLARNAVNYLSPTTLSEAFLSTPLGIVIRWASPSYAEQLLSDHKRAALKNIADTNILIDKLAGEWFDAAKTGIPAPDGTDNWTEWRRKAMLIADSLQDYVEYQSDASLIYNAPQLISEFVISLVNCATNPTACMEGPGIPKIPIPWWAWAGGIGVAAIGVSYVFNTFAPRRR